MGWEREFFLSLPSVGTDGAGLGFSRAGDFLGIIPRLEEEEEEGFIQRPEENIWIWDLPLAALN